MAEFFLKNSSANYNFYGNLHKNYPLVYNTLLNANSEINKSSSMSDMGFGDYVMKLGLTSDEMDSADDMSKMGFSD